MATRKIYDLAVKTGSYTDRDGNQKGRYTPAGAIWEKDDGSKFITLNRTFNPAGVPNPENKEAVILSQFEVKERNGQTQQQSAPARQQQPAAQKPQGGGSSGFDDMDDDIPFVTASMECDMASPIARRMRRYDF